MTKQSLLVSIALVVVGVMLSAGIGNRVARSARLRSSIVVKAQAEFGDPAAPAGANSSDQAGNEAATTGWAEQEEADGSWLVEDESTKADVLAPSQLLLKRHGGAGGAFSFSCSGEHTEEGLRTGQWHEYYSSGAARATVSYHDGRLTGVFRQWFPDGGLREESAFLDGRRHGRSIRWAEDGHVLWDHEFVMGRPVDGTWVRWHEGGSIARRVAIVNGKYEGEGRSWYADGQLEWQVLYSGGRRHGPGVHWWPNGCLRARGQFSDGQKSGVWEYWDGCGRVQSKDADPSGE